MALGLSLAFIAAASSPALADQVRRNEWWLRTLHVTSAWETTRGSGVTIAVLDTGVAPAQADLTGSVTTGPDYTNSGRTAGGQFWGIHGTEVASLIAGHGHGPGQANGIIGIAPAAKILSVRVTLESNDPALSDQTIAAGLPTAIARGIKWAVRHGASVIDLPLDPVTASGAPGSGGSPAEHAAVNYAIAKHVVLVAPAGDGGAGTDPVNYPAGYHGVISVGAFDRHFVKAPFTSHQSYVLVTAAGAGVTAAAPATPAPASTSASYPPLNSTSAASAMVAGIVALIRAQFPTLTPAQVAHALTTSTVYRPSGGRADGSGYGTVDAARALTAAAGIAESVPKSAASGTTGTAAPSPPASHSSPIHRNIRGTLIKDAVIAGVVFLLLLGLIFGITAWRRRNARSARLAEVRAAVQPPVRNPVVAKPAVRGLVKKGSPAGAQTAVTGAQAGAGDPDAETAEPQLEPAGFIAAPLGPGPGGSGFTGSASPAFTGSAAGFTGSGFTGSGSGFTGSGFTGSAAGFTGSGFAGSASSGFAAAPTPPGPGIPAALGAAGTSSPGGISPPPGLVPTAGSGSSTRLGIDPPSGVGPLSGPGAVAGLSSPAAGDPSGGTGALAGLGSPAGPGPDASTPGEAAPDLAQPAGAGTGLPPWALISRDPATRAAASAAIPGSAFPGAPGAPPAGEAAGAAEPAGVTRMSSRLTQTPRQPRTPQVSGRPPWDPAPEPDSDLPWAQGPAPTRSPAAPLPRREEVRPQLPAWEEMAQDAWPGGPKLAAPHPPVPPFAEPNARPGHEGARPVGSRVVPAAGLVPPQPDSPEQPRRADYARNPGAGAQAFRAPQDEPGSAPGGTSADAENGPPTGAAPPGASPSAVSQPGVPPVRRPSLALPRRLGSSMARQAGSTAGGGETPADADVAGQVPASGGLAVPGTADGGLADAGATGSVPASPSWPGSGASQPPFPPAPRPATELSPPDTGQPERGPFPRAIKPPTDPGPAGAAAWSGGTITSGPSGDGPAFPQLDRPANGPGPAQGLPPDVGATPPSTAKPGVATPGAAKPKTGVPPWEITDSFLAVPPVEASATPGRGAPAADQPSNPEGASGWGGPAADQPGNPPGASTEGGGPADSTESFPAVDSGADQRSLPRSNSGDSTESFPAVRPRADLEDAFRLFPPVRGTDSRPPADGQD